MRNRFAVPLFAVGLAAVLVANLYEFAAGISRALLNPATMIVTAAIVTIAILQLWYSNALRTRTTFR